MIRIVIADDSVFFNEILKETLESVKGFSVVGAALNGREAINLAKAMKPDILILDCEMPGINGLEALRIIMKECPLPVLILSSLTYKGSSVTIKALEYGAVDFLLKPAKAGETLESMAAELIERIRLIVFKSRFARLCFVSKPQKSSAVLSLPRRLTEVIAMGSSMGGVQATMQVVPKLPKNMPPIVWVQHMPPIFTKNFADRLASLSAIHVKEAIDGEELRHGVCYLAKGGLQMRLENVHGKYHIRAKDTEVVSGHCPSCNVLFHSVAEHFGEKALGVILTGMGDDGAEGLVAMHNRGAYVIGQDEGSSVVYGMPKSAYRAGAVDVQLNIDDIAQGIMQVAGKG